MRCGPRGFLECVRSLNRSFRCMPRPPWPPAHPSAQTASGSMECEYPVFIQCCPLAAHVLVMHSEESIANPRLQACLTESTVTPLSLHYSTSILTLHSSCLCINACSSSPCPRGRSLQPSSRPSRAHLLGQQLSNGCRPGLLCCWLCMPRCDT